MKPIDADELTRKIKELDWRCRKMISSDGEKYREILRAVQTLIDDAPAVDPPPNPPLTLEELREMDGELVWIAELGINYGNGHYVMFYGFDGHENKAHFYNEYSRSSNDYGHTWLAYRRKPDEVTT